MWETIIEPNLLPMVLMAIAVLAAIAKKKGWLDAKMVDMLKEDVQGVVTAIYHEYVKERKIASEDGKLTEEEKKEAREKAILKLKEIGKEKGIDYVKKYGLPLILGLVEKYVQSNKKVKTEV